MKEYPIIIQSRHLKNGYLKNTLDDANTLMLEVIMNTFAVTADIARYAIRNEEFKSLNRSFFKLQSKVSKRRKSPLISIRYELPVSLELFFVEYKFYRTVKKTFSVLSRFDRCLDKIQIKKTEYEDIMKHFGSTIQDTNDIIKGFKDLPVETIHHRYFKKGLEKFESVCDLYDDILDMNDECLAARIKDKSTEYVPEETFWAQMNV